MVRKKHLDSDSYPIFKGEAFEEWRQQGLFRAPGGSGEVASWEDMDDGFVRARAGDRETTPMVSRWKKAQAAEAAFWQSWRENVLYRHVSLSDFWADVLEKTGGDLPPGRILDVGCGPVSVLNFFRCKGMKPMGIDPLAEVYARRGLLEYREGWQPISIAALPAERLPFAAESMDHLICYNVLDHVSDASAVLGEMRRVLKQGGSLRIYVHTFAAWIKRFLFFDRPHTYHWEHDEFRELLRSAGFRILTDLLEPKTFDLPPGLWGKLSHFPYWVATKVAATSYFQLQKP